MTQFADYQHRFPNARLTRSPSGVLEIALHTDGGKLVFNGHTHEQFVDLFHAVNEIVPADGLLARAHELAEQLAALPPLTNRYTRIALTQTLRRIVDEGAGYGLALEGISAADVARRMAATG